MNVRKIKKYGKIGFKNLSNHAQTRLFVKTGKFLPPPMKICYSISRKCNYRCKMCPIWEQGNSEKTRGYISDEKMKSIIDEAAECGIVQFGVSGGEPLLFKDKLFNLLDHANKKGMYSHFVTNGSLLTSEILEHYDSIGGGHVSMSLDAMSEKHDVLRGHEGAFEAAMKAVEIFDKGSFRNINFKINLVISNDNLDDVLPVINFAVEHETVFFMQPYETISDFSGEYSIEEKEEKMPLWVKRENYDKLKEVINKVNALKKQHPEIILNEQNHINSIYDYFRNIGNDNECYAGIDQLMIDPYGKVTFCKFGELADLSQDSLKDYLSSGRREAFVKESLKCQRICLIGCMYRPSLIDLVKNGPKQFYKLVKN